MSNASPRAIATRRLKADLLGLKAEKGAYQWKITSLCVRSPITFLFFTPERRLIADPVGTWKRPVEATPF